VGRLIGGIVLALFGGILFLSGLIFLFSNEKYPVVLLAAWGIMTAGGVLVARAGLKQIKERATPLQPIGGPVASTSSSSSPSGIPAGGALPMAAPTPMRGDKICRNCGYLGRQKTRVKGNMGTEIFLYFLMILPGLFYSIWRLSTKAKVCPKCNATETMLPLDTPAGRELYAHFYTPGTR
jgi:hypothetical protein